MLNSFRLTHPGDGSVAQPRAGTGWTRAAAKPRRGQTDATGEANAQGLVLEPGTPQITLMQRQTSGSGWQRQLSGLGRVRLFKAI